MVPYPDASPRSTGSLVDVLDRVLDKGLVVAGDIRVSLADVELLTIRIRLLVCSIDKAEEIGLNWWKSDPALSSGSVDLVLENRSLRERVRMLESRLDSLLAPPHAAVAAEVPPPSPAKKKTRRAK